MDNKKDVWFNLIPASTAEKLLNPTAEQFGMGLGGLASFIMNPLVKLGLISEGNLNKFEKKILEKNSTIPEGNRDSSKAGLALKALEDSVYQLESETLQDMFANLISSSLDDRKNESVHPSFSSILKDLSPDNANLFLKIFQRGIIASASIQVYNSETYASRIDHTNYLLLDDEFVEAEQSLIALKRFGLIDYQNSSPLVGEEFGKLYQRFKESELVTELNKSLPIITSDNVELDKLKVQNGFLRITELGTEFGKVITNQMIITVE